MNFKRRLIESLLRSYPAEWRREYGAELADLLATHTLGIRVVADVLWSGVQQRMRSREPATLLGSVAMFASFALLLANVVAPQPYQAVVKVGTACLQPDLTMLIRSLARSDPPYYTRAHGDGHPTQATTATRTVGGGRRLADDRGASLLSAGERAAGRP